MASSPKDQFQLVPVGALREVARAFAEGAEKYEAWKWRRGSAWRDKQMAAAMRHINKWLDGCDSDDDSGVHPLAHAASRLMILVEFALDKRFHKFDDRGIATKGPAREPK